MSAAKLFKLVHDEARHGVAEYARVAPAGTVVQFLDPVKSREQEEKYHAIIGEIAAKELLYGKRMGPEAWKRLLIAAFKHDTNTDEYPDLKPLWAKFGNTELLPMLGDRPGFVMVGDQSRKFPVKLAAAFITWLESFQDGAA